MGWLFAVALGLHRQGRRIVLLALAPIALGHATAVALVALAFVALGLVAEPRLVSGAAGVALLGWALYHALYGSRHRVRVGMRTGLAGLALWSFLMASAHGAGLMLLPILFPLPPAGGAGPPPPPRPPPPVAVSRAAVGVHTLATLATTGAIAVAVYEWVGVAFLRRGWINLDLLWTLALVVTGAILLVTALR